MTTKIRLWTTVCAGLFLYSMACGSEAFHKWKAGNAGAYEKITTFLRASPLFKTALSNAVNDDLGTLNTCLPFMIEINDNKLNDHMGKNKQHYKTIKLLRDVSTDQFKEFREILRTNATSMGTLFKDKAAFVGLLDQDDPVVIAKEKLDKEKAEKKKADAKQKADDAKQAAENKKKTAADPKKSADGNKDF